MTETPPPADWARLRIVQNQSRSVSQASQYLSELGGCPHRYYLSRIVQAWDRPAAWFAQGLGVHQAAEFWERSGRTASVEEMLATFYAAYDARITEDLANTPNPDAWMDSGFRYPGPVDIERRRELGAEMVRRYHDYYVNQKPGEVIWITPSGEPAIELGFSVMFGSVRVTGFIDQILHLMRDIKSGNKPGTIFQLATYRYAMNDEYGVDFPTGDFWMGKTGKPTKPYNLDNMTREQVTDLYERLDAGVKAEEFAPDPSPEKCSRCSVRTACVYAM